MTEFVHRFLAGSVRGGPTLLLLHGTGGDENDLLPLGRALLPQAALLSPRGKVLEGNMPRFFRRLAEGVFDQQDLLFRTEELHKFLDWASTEYAVDRKQLFAVGFSNGANIASSLLLRFPEDLAGAVLIRGMVPFEAEKSLDLHAKPVLLLNGRLDGIAPPIEAETLLAIYKKANAKAELVLQNASHELTQADIVAARRWLKIHAAPVGTAIAEQ